MPKSIACHSQQKTKGVAKTVINSYLMMRNYRNYLHNGLNPKKKNFSFLLRKVPIYQIILINVHKKLFEPKLYLSNFTLGIPGL